MYSMYQWYFQILHIYYTIYFYIYTYVTLLNHSVIIPYHCKSKRTRASIFESMPFRKTRLHEENNLTWTQWNFIIFIIFCFSLLNVSHLKSIWYSFQAVLYRSAMAFERCSFHLENETLPEKGSLLFKQTCCHLKYAVFKCIWREEIHTIFRKRNMPL